jgi:aspartate/methionine/tyrosine aminotransferase
MYLFPKLDFPEQAHIKAKQQGRPTDAFYALRLLEATGVCMVPGTGFGQQPGTFHVRTTFLPDERDLDDVITRLQSFHAAFIDEFS